MAKINETKIEEKAPVVPKPEQYLVRNSLSGSGVVKIKGAYITIAGRSFQIFDSKPESVSKGLKFHKVEG